MLRRIRIFSCVAFIVSSALLGERRVDAYVSCNDYYIGTTHVLDCYLEDEYNFCDSFWGSAPVSRSWKLSGCGRGVLRGRFGS
jgi:hypothetical protein